jgi:general secretion pathway protein B
MSLILDALRKMEQDRKNRSGAALDIRPEVLRYRVAAQPQRSRPYLPVALGIVLLLACGIGAGFFLKGKGAATAPQEIAPVTQVAPVVPAVAAPAVEVPPAQPLPAPVPVEPVTQNPTRQPVAAQVSSRPEPAIAQPKAQHREAAAPSQAAGDITISGIAWQDERTLRRAVLNGALVGEGAEVAGARVVEIREDKVKLSRGGQVFEVLLSSSFSSR